MPPASAPPDAVMSGHAADVVVVGEILIELTSLLFFAVVNIATLPPLSSPTCRIGSSI